MKKKIKIFIGILLLTVLGYLGYSITKKLSYKKEVAERIKEIPNFSFLQLDGTPFTQDNLQNKPTVFVYFNSDCDYCKSEATKIQQQIAEFKEVQLIFISFEETEGIKQFAKTYQLDNLENVTFLEDKKGVFSELFDAKTIPYILVYDANKNLLQKFKGVTKIDKILNVLK